MCAQFFHANVFISILFSAFLLVISTSLCGFATVGDKHFLLLGVYRPGSQTLSAAFFDELSTVLELLAVHSCPVVVCGDFNIHVDQSGDPHAIRLAELLLSFDCI